MKTDYQLIRSDRRTLSVSINGQGALVVRAPKHMPLREIEAFLAQKARWIAQKQAQMRAAAPAPFLPADGAKLPYLGGTLTLRLCRVPLCIDFDGFLLVPDRGDALAHIRAWRKERAAQVLGARVALWTARTGIQVSAVHYGQARCRWGSMSRAGSLRLNAALLHCPLEAVDYVIVHELAHRLHPDHSPAFHAQVRRFLPEADALRRGMRAFSAYPTLLNNKEAP